MKPEVLQPVSSTKRTRSKRTYALCFSVDYPGDFELAGYHWRVMTGVEARSAKEADKHFETAIIKGPHAKYMATSYDPALDILRQRRFSLRS
jgi:hypothetical protein